MPAENEHNQLEIMRHSMSHILAMAVLDMLPEAKLGIGPAIDNGFYYDFDLPRTLIPEDLPLIEKKMRQIIAQDLTFEQGEENSTDAIKKLEETDQTYKIELAKDLWNEGNEQLSFYRTGEFVDLCSGPHVASTKELQAVAFKLDKIAGAYWKGSEQNPMLQRIYALAFANSEELKKYEQFLVEAARRDHRKIGNDLDLFSFHEEAPGFPFWHPKGMVVWNQLLDWWREEHHIAGYEEIKTPLILAEELWHQSGHYEHYRDHMYFTTIDERPFSVKPMNCPGGILVYKTNAHSYREFPLRLAEVGLVHRHELAGTLHGLMRVRSFHQDDAHVYCLPEQIENEIIDIINLIDKMYGRLGLSYHMELSTRPEEGSIGTDEMWEKAESSLRQALEKKGVEYKLNPGDGAFYGPKIDFHIADAIGRTWQTATIQLDFAMPERFDLEYAAEDGSRQRPVMLHRVIFGAIERFIGVLIEHFAGDFPVWLAPVQATVLPVSDKAMDYAKAVTEELKGAGVRVELDDRTESIGKKIRAAEMQKVPYMLVVGEKEQAANNVSVRTRTEADKGLMTVEAIIADIKKDSQNQP
jgi:threonyl-tRNA synthetase